MQRHSRIEEQRRSVGEYDANVRKGWQEEMTELKWRIVTGEVVRNIQGDECAVTCMEVLRIMRGTGEDKALVAAVDQQESRIWRGEEKAAVWDSRDALAL